MHAIIYTNIISLLLLLTNPVIAEISDDDDFYLLYGDEDMISIATGYAQPISKSPSTASVITAADIKRMGSITIEQVLESIPGVHTSLSTLTSLSQVNIRGIKTSITPQVLIMLNGYRISSELLSGVFSESAKINLQSISRIEIIRGPGSAIYGADAFSGVVNIVTKDAREINGLTAGVRGGSNDTKNSWLQYGVQLQNDWELAFNLEYASQDADTSQIVNSDVQTAIDGFALGAPASLAPGYLDYRYKSTSYNFHLNNEYWKIGMDGWIQRDVGQGAGVALALDSKGRGDFDHHLLSLEYNSEDLINNWQLSSKLSFQSIDAQYKFNIFPAGSSLLIGADGNAFSAPHASCPVGGCIVQFPDGYIGNPGRKSSIPQLDVIALYEGLDTHNLRFNIGVKKEKLEANESKNFGPGIIDGLTPVINGTLTNVTGMPGAIYTSDDERTIKYLSIQDVWEIASDWVLTAGIRYDDYSDFGGTTNPRLALVWSTYDNLTSKILFGSAFRAPSFSELNNKNNPVAIGNSNLNPETIDTTELVFSYKPTNELSTNLSIYYFKTKEMISYTGTAGLAENAKSLNGKGFELETDWAINKKWRLRANYSYQNTKDESTDTQEAFVPQHQMYMDLSCNYFTNWELSSQLNWVANRERETIDTRDNIDDYTLVNLNIRRTNLSKHLEAAIVIDNLFNKDAREPSSNNTITDDFPLNERRLYVELRYQID